MILDTVVFAIVLGIAAQVLAERLRIPAILPLLTVGIVAGPGVLGLVHPSHLGEGLEVLVHVGVAVILFEGGLSLDLRQLSKVGTAIRNLLSVGAVISTLGAAALAHYLADISWPLSLLFGAIVMVTGPTVIAPLLRHMVVPRKVKVILTSEGLIIDAIGATTAYFVLIWVENTGLPLQSLEVEVLKVAAVGSILGFTAGSLCRLILKRRFVGGEVQNLTILSILLLTYLIAEHQAPQSGILASVLMGVTLSAGDLPDLSSVRVFKGQLTTFLISFVFVLLAAQLDLEAIVELGWRGAAVTAGLILVARPLAVFLSVPPSQVDLKERAVLALTAPRGIVAAAVASLAALSLRSLNIEGGEVVEALVYLVILVTGAWATAMAMVLPRLFGYLDDPTRRRAILVGANSLTLELARLFKENGRGVAVVDSVPWRLDRFRDLGLFTVVGDARDAVSYEEASADRDSWVLAATTNDDLNLLVAELVHGEFGVEHPIVALQTPPEDFGVRSRGWAALLGGEEFDVGLWSRRVETGQAELVQFRVSEDRALGTLKDIRRRWPEDTVLLGGVRQGELSLRVDLDNLGEMDSVYLLVTPGMARDVLESARAHLVDEESKPSDPILDMKSEES